MITQTNTVDLQRQIVVHCEQLPGQLLQTPGLNTRDRIWQADNQPFATQYVGHELDPLFKRIDTRSTQIEPALGHGSAPEHHDVAGSEIQPSVDL